MTHELPRNRLPLFAAVTLICLVVDLWSKEAVFEAFGLRNGTPWLIDSWVRFRLFTSLNEGALWGMGQGMARMFALLSIVAFAGILYWLFIHKAAESLWLTVSLSFVSGGTLGNLYDRLGWHGIVVPGQNEPIRAVRDFFHFQFGTFDWAIFNVADICLVTGAIMLMIQSLMAPADAALPVKSESR
ncbi:MAG: signal peptidase II [Planctomycetaceae bacterium]